MECERREHGRLAIRLPMECEIGGVGQSVRAFTSNISTGGVYFEVDLPQDICGPQPRTPLKLGLTVPPGAGHFPYQGRLLGTAEVVRCQPIPTAPVKPGHARYGLAARFQQRLELAF